MSTKRKKPERKLDPLEIDWLQSLPGSDREDWLREYAAEDPREAAELRDLIGCGHDNAYGGFPRPELAEFLGVSEADIDYLRKCGMPCDLPGARGTGLGGKNYYDVRECARWLAAVRLGRGEKTDPEKEAEALKSEQRKLAELRRRKMEGQLVEVVKLRKDLDDVSSRVRRTADELSRTIGPAAAEQLERVWEEIERALLSGADLADGE